MSERARPRQGFVQRPIMRPAGHPILWGRWGVSERVGGVWIGPRSCDVGVFPSRGSPRLQGLAWPGLVPRGDLQGQVRPVGFP